LSQVRAGARGAQNPAVLPFARTKIQPPRPRAGSLLARPALHARLVEAMLTRALALVCAPAGYGKTSALVQALDALPAGTAVAWLSCDEDDTPLMLFSCLVAALEPFDLPWRSAPEALIDAALAAEATAEARTRSLRTMVTALINALDAAEVAHGVIVVDDLHRIPRGPVHEFTDLLLERFTPRWTLVLASRSEPPIALARLRARGELAEFRADELLLTPEEARELVQRAGLEAALAEPLYRRTEGWAAGVQLALSALRTAGAAASAGGGSLVDRRMFEFLATEVVNDLPPELRRFLLECSVLPELNAARCAAVTGDPLAALRLDAIERAGLFVTSLPGAEPTLRLHDLFREALEQMLAREQPERLPELLRRAALTEPQGLRRIAGLLRAQAWADAEAALVAEGDELMTEGAAPQVRELFERLPAARRAAAPALQLLGAQLAWARWDWPAMQEAAAASVAGYEAAGDDAAGLARARSFRAIALAGGGQPEAAREVVDALLADPALADDTAARTLLAASWLEITRGDPRRVGALWARLMTHLERLSSLARWFECMPLPPFVGLPGMRGPLLRYVQSARYRWPDRPSPPRGMCTAIEGLLHLWAGDVARAQECADAAEDDARWLARPVNLDSYATLLQAFVHAVRGRSGAAQALLARQIRAVEEAGEPRRARLYLPLYLYVALRCAATAGDAASVQQLAARLHALAQGDGAGPLRQHLAGAPAYAAAARGDWPAAERLWRELLAREGEADLYGQVAEARLRLADALLHQKRGPAEAAAALAPLFHRLAEGGGQGVQGGQGAQGLQGEWGVVLLAGPAVLGRLAAQDWQGALPEAQRSSLVRWAAEARRWSAAQPDVAGTAAVATAATVPTALTAPAASAFSAAGPPSPSAAARPAPGPAAEERTGALAGSPLSAREMEILERLAAGDSNKLIARAFDLSPHTVKRHVANILDKLELHSRGQVAAWYHARVKAGG